MPLIEYLYKRYIYLHSYIGCNIEKKKDKKLCFVVVVVVRNYCKNNKIENCSEFVFFCFSFRLYQSTRGIKRKKKIRERITIIKVHNNLKKCMKRILFKKKEKITIGITRKCNNLYITIYIIFFHHNIHTSNYARCRPLT